nr:DUF4275 family protein [Mesobacillus sp. S13]
MNFFDKLKCKKLQISKTEGFGYDVRQKWEAAFASHLSPKEKERYFFMIKAEQAGFCGICSAMKKENAQRKNRRNWHSTNNTKIHA